jgi:hypothetical protein
MRKELVVAVQEPALPPAPALPLALALVAAVLLRHRERTRKLEPGKH